MLLQRLSGKMVSCPTGDGAYGGSAEADNKLADGMDKAGNGEYIAVNGTCSFKACRFLFALDRVTEDRHGVLFDLPQGKEKRKIIFEKQKNLTKMKCENCGEKSMKTLTFQRLCGIICTQKCQKRAQKRYKNQVY